jgi:hypothetical protein
MHCSPLWLVSIILSDEHKLKDNIVTWSSTSDYNIKKTKETNLDKDAS